jgi:DNA replication and repair protein RecF
MNIRTIALRDFRNYRSFSAEFSEKVNVIVGRNAQGKTNLLEAVYYLTAGRSFRARNDKELIRFDADGALSSAETFLHDRNQKMEVFLYRAKRRQFFVNGVKLRTAAELSADSGAVLFTRTTSI